MQKIRVVSLFSGCGGLDLGFIQAGYTIVWANDFFRDAVQTYRKNIGNHIVHGDITQISSEDIPDCDVLIGGFPCQSFSIANTKRSMEDKRNFLYLEVLRVLRDKKPNFFVCENVKGLLSMGKGRILDMIVKDFSELGYKVDYHLMRASDYGVPQHRERVIIIGNRLGLENVFPEKKDIPHVSVSDVCKHLYDIRTRDESFELDGIKIHNHVASTNVADTFWARKHPVKQHDICDYLRQWRCKSDWTIKKIDRHLGYRHTSAHWFRKDNYGTIPNPNDWWKLKEILGFDNTFDEAVTELEQKDITFEQSLRINNWDTPSDTILTTSPEIHPNKKRRMSVRECAIIQTFPNNFVFTGSLSSMYKQIGNAVPVLLGKEIAEAIKPCILRKK